MTKIEWTHRPGTKGETWNPVTGCTKISPGCRNCYAERMSKRLAGRFGYPADEPFRVTLHPDRLDEPLRWKKPRTCFVCSMGDLFHEDVPFDFILKVFSIMWGYGHKHTFLVLTKRPLRMLEFYNWMVEDEPREPLAENVWLGVTCEDQQRANERIPLLLVTPAAVRFVSIEPMLGAIHLFGLRGGSTPLNWVIVGGETGPGRREMRIDWARDVRDQCQAAGLPFFFKRTGNGATPDDLKIREWPEAD